MFDFLMSQTFWLEVIIESIIIIVVVIIALTPKQPKVVEHIAKWIPQHNEFPTEHQSIQVSLTDTRNAIQASLTDTRNAIQTVKDVQLVAVTERRLEYASLSEAQRRLADSAKHIGKFADEFARLSSEVQTLRLENQTLHQKIESMQVENTVLRSRSSRRNQNPSRSQADDLEQEY